MRKLLLILVFISSTANASSFNHQVNEVKKLLQVACKLKTLPATQVYLLPRNIKTEDTRHHYGTCFIEHDIIIITKEDWGTITPHFKQLLLLHELGHCALGLPHNATTGNIMHPNDISESLSITTALKQLCTSKRKGELFK